MKIIDVDVLDVRFPTSRTLDGSDAVHLAPDYSAAYVVLRTDDGPDGHGLTFTIGRGTEVVVEAVRSLAPFVRDRDAEEMFGDMRAFWHQIVGDSQLRWIGPEKGAIHLAGAAVVNAVWDLYAKSRGKPLWKLLADMTPREIVDAVDFTYITDAITPDEALDLLAGTRRPAPTARRTCAPRATRPMSRRSAGWATTTPRSSACATRRWPRGGPASR